MDLNKIYNEDCFETIEKKIQTSGIKVSNIITSPPYNTGRTVVSEYAMKTRNQRYDIYLDDKTSDEYIQWSVDLFNSFDKILKKDGSILYNISYGNDFTQSPDSIGLVWRVISHIIENTNFTVADRIIWKKKSALPNNVSSNRLTRIVEDVFVFCRKPEILTFYMNKEVKSVNNDTGQKFYTAYMNLIDAKNNDEICPYNKATYSTDLVNKLLKLYVPKDGIVYDPFMGSGTTAVSCKQNKITFIGSELSEKQCEWANDRLYKVNVVESIKSGNFKGTRFNKLIAQYVKK